MMHLGMTAEEAWKEYRKRGEAVESFESFKRRWDAKRSRHTPEELAAIRRNEENKPWWKKIFS